MKKYVILASVLLTLAGCSASAAVATTPHVVTKSVAVSKQVLSLDTLRLQMNKSNMQKVITRLKAQVHKTYYVFSGDSPRGWDCSGLVVWTYKQLGLTLPHSATAQAHLGTKVNEPKIGDIVVFGYKGSYYYDHSGIYIGDGKVINANKYYGTTVIEPLSNFKYYSNIRFIRVLPMA
ncbi:outer membrane lipoprotein [uncultured Caudovirales phage]|uniref:Outer membrane lipoprotein n=1 Tax=uncultured Caudovirales phage TaxID=2100421 RepID=A0A6J7WRD6_9CAUD|nr:outer membrane lipoprotein [uncultured Caudovirales phage]CAB5219345.1 outer membrane lipoprotein [uncultured Caudovirales phage]